MTAILLVDDEPNILDILTHFVEGKDRQVLRATSAKDALRILREQNIHIVISDISMPDMSGVELLKETKSFSPETVFVMVTAFASTDTAIEALRHGAYDFLTKPLKMEEVRNIVAHVIEKPEPVHEAGAQRKETEAHQSQSLFQALQRNRIVGKGPKMLEIYRTIGTVAAGDSTILITGESGTGKELVARAIHDASLRKNGPFVTINCGAFPETLLESELFGYMKGAFTGAANNRKGLFEAANGGSIFLDEIGETAPAVQVKLLRVLQERKLRPLGGNAEVPVDVRVITATNRDLNAAIQHGSFREDLYYRIAVIGIRLPPLRERTEDIPLLAFHFVRQYADKTGKQLFGISREALTCLERYGWPGNVLELENTIERAVHLETTESIQIEQLPDPIRNPDYPTPAGRIHLPEVPFEGPFDLEAFMTNLEREIICRVLERTNGNQTIVAQQLGLTKPSLRHKIQTLGIDPARYRRGSSTS